MKQRIVLCLAALIVILLAAVPIDAYGDSPSGVPRPALDDGERAGRRHAHQHGEDGGHLPASQHNVELIGQLTVTDQPGRIADVAAFRDFAYLAAFAEPACEDGGVYVVDISDPRHPKEAGFIPTTPGSFVGEGVQVVSLDTRAFKGDLLIHNNEICAEGGEGGASLWDVTDPRNPEPLALHFGDDTDDGIVNMIHSALVWETGHNAYAVLVDDEESTDVDIFDITDPRRPVLLTETGLGDWPEAQDEQAAGMGTFAFSFFHDVQVKRFGGRWTMLLSYWDAGWVLLDVSDPANPQYIADSDYPDPDRLTGFSPPEGNAHQAEFDSDYDFIVATDEDFDPFRVVGKNMTDDTEFLAALGSNVTLTEEGDFLSGTAVFVGRACNDDDPVPSAPAGVDQPIAVVERGVCFFSEKAANVEAAGGYVGIVIMNREGADACASVFAPGVESALPAVFVGRDTGFEMFDVPFDADACLDDTPELAPIEPGAIGDEVSFSGAFDGWGYVRLLDAQTLEEIDTYAISESLDPAYATGFGALSVHEVATDRTRQLGYLAYYAGGLRVIKFNEKGIREVGHYIAEGGNDFWGVEAYRTKRWENGKETLILASDRDSGLWIFRYTGDD